MRSVLRCLLAVAPLLAVACDQPRHLTIQDGARDVVSSGVELGAHKILLSTERTLTITNRSGERATIEAITLGPMTTASYTIAADDCTQQQLAAEIGHCTIRVAFAPQAEGALVANLALRYRVDGDNYTIDVALRGSGVLDCALTPELQQARSQGATEATAKNADEAARGDADGRLLTRDDGYSDGYKTSYDQGYKNGYDDPTYGYDAGYDYGYDDGFAAGRADPTACSDGQYDGSSLGGSEGAADGVTAGYNAGYDAGYGTGYADGQDGCIQGTYSIAPPKHPTDTAPAPASEKWLSACRAQGYSATLNANAYNAAYAAARANNAPYQAGYSEGTATGGSVGTAAGRADGYKAGDEAGYTTGYMAGASDSYTRCYASAYESTYDAAYQNAYQSSSGYNAGYDAGYNNGYDAGYAYVCPTY